jgi:hypothetical protein
LRGEAEIAIDHGMFGPDSTLPTVRGLWTPAGQTCGN